MLGLLCHHLLTWRRYRRQRSEIGQCPMAALFRRILAISREAPNLSRASTVHRYLPTRRLLLRERLPPNQIVVSKRKMDRPSRYLSMLYAVKVSLLDPAS